MENLPDAVTADVLDQVELWVFLINQRLSSETDVAGLPEWPDSTDASIAGFEGCLDDLGSCFGRTFPIGTVTEQLPWYGPTLTVTSMFTVSSVRGTGRPARRGITPRLQKCRWPSPETRRSRRRR